MCVCCHTLEVSTAQSINNHHEKIAWNMFEYKLCSSHTAKRVSLLILSYLTPILSSLFLCVCQGLPIAWYLLLNDITMYKNCLNGKWLPTFLGRLEGKERGHGTIVVATTIALWWPSKGKNHGCMLKESLYGPHNRHIGFLIKLKPFGYSKLAIMAHLTG